MTVIAMATYSKLGCLHEQQGDLAAAAQWHAKAIGLAADSVAALLPSHPALAEVVEGFAALAAARGQHDRAAELLGLAHTLHGFCDAASLDVARTTAVATREIGPAAFEAAYARGRGLSRAEAVALVP